MDRYVDEYYKTKKNSGVIRVTYKDKIIYEGNMGYADIENKIEFTKDSMFSIYSLTKPFCTIGLLKLRDKNLVDIDADPANYIPEAKWIDNRVTIRQMLYHVSGIPDFMQDAEFDKKYPSGLPHEIRGYLEKLSSNPMLFEPGKQDKYANINFTLAALIIENVSGMKYADYMKKEVFEPLGMKTAVVDDENVIVSNRVKGYDKIDDKIVRVDRSLDWMFGGGDIVATVDDVYCLNKAIKHKTLLKPDTWTEVLTPLELNSRGMGCTIGDWNGKTEVTHNGANHGFRSLHTQFIDDDLDIIYLSNSNWGSARRDLPNAICQAFYSKENHTIDETKMDVGYI